MCFPQLRAAMVSVVCAIVLPTGCAVYYGTIGRASETQVAPDSYRWGSFPPDIFRGISPIGQHCFGAPS
jgi:hypothetical protein